MKGTALALHPRRYLLSAAALLIGVTALGCGDDNDDITNVVPNTVVAVFKDTAFNFNSINTFVMPDTVVHFMPATGTPIDVTHQFDRQILDRVRSNLLSRGYTPSTNPQAVTPSFVVLVGASATTNYNAFLTYSWFPYYGAAPVWGWFTPGFTNSWGLTFPWYNTVGVTAYDRGSLVVTIVPTSSVDTVNKTVKAAWAGTATSVLIDPNVTSATIATAIDHMFALSPYLVPGPLVSPAGP